MTLALDPYDKEVLGPYWQALGEFVFYYARLEHELHVVLAAITGLVPKISAAVFQDVPMNRAIGIIRRIRDEAGFPFPPRFDECLNHAGEIASQRNMILHYGLQRGLRGVFVTTEGRSLPSKVKSRSVSVADLSGLTRDTITVWANLLLLHRMLQGSKLSHPHEEGWMIIAKRPWLYKPARPNQQTNGTRVSRKTRNLQRRTLDERSQRDGGE